MKILVSWLRDFVEVPGSPEDIARTMSVRGFAVESIDPVGSDVSAEARSAKADAVLDFEVTANRPDCMSVMGMAREVATAYGLQVRRPIASGASLRHPATPGVAGTPPEGSTGGPQGSAPQLSLKSLKAVEKSDVDVVIENPDLCPRYAGAVADVTIGPSSEWMQARLRAAGVRPISNIVDVTNYVLIEMGHPMHAFDLTKLAGGQIRVRTARPGETLRTLDGELRNLSPDMLVIADAERASAIAGVMGGIDSEVTNETKTIVLESAYFNPLSVRRTSKKLGLKTEASMRFERGADPRLPVTAMERAAALLESIGAGRARGAVVDRYPSRTESRMLRLRREKVKGLLGSPIPDADVKRILDGLGFALREASEGWDVTVPTRRVDVLREVDLIEEVARHYGFDRLPVTFPALDAAPPPVDPRITRARKLRIVLTGMGFSEAVTFGFVSLASATPFASAEDIVPIANPLSESYGVLRPSVIPGLLDAVGHNRRREQRDVRLFEIGARFGSSHGERQVVACAWSGAATPEHWSGGARDVDFFDMKGVVGRICEALGVVADVRPCTPPEPWLAPGRSAGIFLGDTLVGVFGQLAPTVAEPHIAPSSDPVYVAEIDLDGLDTANGGREMRVEPLPRYPSVIRDISILVDHTVVAADVRRTIRDAAPGTLVRVREFDRYQGKGIPENKVSLSLRLTFRSSDRTLTDTEVQAAMDNVLAALRDRHSAVQR